MNHEVNVRFGGEIIGTAEISDNGETAMMSVDLKKIPEKFRATFDVTQHLSIGYDDITPNYHKQIGVELWDSDSTFVSEMPDTFLNQYGPEDYENFAD